MAKKDKEFEKWWDDYSYWAELDETNPFLLDAVRTAYNQGRRSGQKKILNWILRKGKANLSIQNMEMEDILKEKLNRLSREE